MPNSTQGQLIDHAVFAERLARRAEAAGLNGPASGGTGEVLASLESRVDQLQRQLEQGSQADLTPREREFEIAARAANRRAADLRGQLIQWRLDLRKSEIQRSAQAVRLAVLEYERTTDGSVARVARQALVQKSEELAHERARVQEQAAALAAARVRVTLIAAAKESERRQQAATLSQERKIYEKTRSRLAEVERELRQRSQQAAESAHTRTSAVELKLQSALGRITELERELATARFELNHIQHRASSAEQRLQVNDLARRVMERELDETRSASKTLAAELASSRLARDQYVALSERRELEVEEVRAELQSERARVQAARSEAHERSLKQAKLHAQVRLAIEGKEETAAELAEAREKIRALEASVRTAQRPEVFEVATIERERVVEVSEHAPRWARSPMLAEESQKLERIVADLDAAASALRESAVPSVSATCEPPAAPEKSATHDALPPKWLRLALRKLAHTNPYVAAQLVVQLLPAHSLALQRKLEYDITLTEIGTFAVSGSPSGVKVNRIKRARPRFEAVFHLRTDIETLTAVLAGEDRRISRFGRDARIYGSKRIFLETLGAIQRTSATWSDLVDSGAQFPPRLVLPIVPFVIDGTWTEGHTFTIALHLTSENETAAGDQWNIEVRSGRAIAVKLVPVGTEADATVKLNPTAFQAFLEGGIAPPSQRPAIRGDRAAVEALKTWTDRSLGRERIGSQTVRSST